MVKPNKLNKGDIIGIIAPSSNVKRDLFLRGVAEIENLGFRTKYLDSIFSKDKYTAGNLKRRLDELHLMFADKEVKAIICARGGYGAFHLLPYLDAQLIKANPKIFIGASDITFLLIYLMQVCDFVVFHGPMSSTVLPFGENSYDKKYFLTLLSYSDGASKIPARNIKVLKPGKCEGIITGGCLSIFISTLGTKWEIDTQDKILFVEDYAVKPYQIDRMLTQLKYSGKLDGVKGIIFGEMKNCIQHPDQGYELQEVVCEVLADFDFPILWGLNSGHTDYNLILPLGVKISFDTDETDIKILEPPVL